MKNVVSLAQKIKSFVVSHKIIILIVIIILGVALFFLRPKPQKPIPLETLSAGEFVQSLSITGTITAEKEVNLTFPIGGTIVYVGVKKGDVVQKFQTIATLDQRTSLKNLQTALTAYSLQRNTFDQTQDNYQNRTPDQALNDAMKRILQNNQYNLNQAITSVELVDLARQQSVLSTPLAGVITRADAKNAGVTALAGTTTFTVTDPDSLQFKMEVDEADIAKVKEGQVVHVNLDSYPEKTLTLVISSIDFVTHTTSTGGNAYDVKAVMPANYNFTYRVGMNGNAQLILSKKQNVLAVPLVSLVDENHVFVKTPKGFVRKTVKIGAENDTSAEILSGLSNGDIIASDPSLVPENKSK